MPPAVGPYRLWLPAARVCRASRSWERCPSVESIIRGPFSPLPRSWRRQPLGFLPPHLPASTRGSRASPAPHPTVKCPGGLALAAAGMPSRCARRRAWPGPPSCVGLWLARGELGVGSGRGEVGGGGGGGEADHRAVDVDAGRAVGGGLAGGRVDPGEQVGPGGGQVEDLVLVDLA